VNITFADIAIELRPSGACYLPECQTLVATDLHLGKALSLRKRGYVLPPHETKVTLNKLAAEIHSLSPQKVVLLGDSFHDHDGPQALELSDLQILQQCMLDTQCLWITGNHDDLGLKEAFSSHGIGLPGQISDQYALKNLLMVHEPHRKDDRPQIVGHYHPKATVDLGHRKLTKPCFLWNDHYLILPAFGTFTGGLDHQHPEITKWMGPNHHAALIYHQKVALV